MSAWDCDSHVSCFMLLKTKEATVHVLAADVHVLATNVHVIMAHVYVLTPWECVSNQCACVNSSCACVSSWCTCSQPHACVSSPCTCVSNQCAYVCSPHDVLAAQKQVLLREVKLEETPESERSLQREREKKTVKVFCLEFLFCFILLMV